MIRILYISLTEQVSGGEISVLNYITALDKTIYAPLVLCPKEGMLAAHARKDDIPVFFHRIPLLSKKKPWKYFQTLLWLVHFIKKERIDILHGMNFYTCQMAGLAGYFAGIPVVIHGQNIFENQKKEIYRNLLFLATKVIVCSKAVGKSLLPTLSENKIFLLHHAVSIPTVIPKKTFFLHKELGLQKNTKLISHIGLLEERKCQDIFISAANHVSQKHKNTAFLIIGDSLFATEAYKQKLYALREKLQLQNTVFFLGLRKDISHILPELDIVTLPSFNEPLAMVTLEACSFAKPYIGAYSGGTSEIIKDRENGLLVQPKNVDELYTALCFMLENPKKAHQMGRNARKTIKEYCNLTKNSHILTELYQSLLKKK
jgi:glycosyltransferase involved in cell wall biosynthesis